MDTNLEGAIKEAVEGQTTEWPQKGQKDKQRSTKHTHKTKYRVTRTPLKTVGELRKGKQNLLQLSHLCH
jgi:hypothetical protein